MRAASAVRAVSAATKAVRKSRAAPGSMYAIQQREFRSSALTRLSLAIDQIKTVKGMSRVDVELFDEMMDTIRLMKQTEK